VRCISKKILLVVLCIALSTMLISCGSESNHREIVADLFSRDGDIIDPIYAIMKFENENFNRGLFNKPLFATNLAVSATDVNMGDFVLDDTIQYGDMMDFVVEAEFFAGGVFSVDDPAVVFGKNMFHRLYPASTTKVMTAIVALKHSDLNDMVTISENAVNFPWYAQMGGLMIGDEVSMYDLVGGLLLHSGNDKAVAIAEHIAGTEEAFVRLMNEEAHRLGATNTNFANSHGLHDANQYTTLYDMYLIFNEAIKDQRFVSIIEKPVVVGRITGGDYYGTVRYIRWYPSNWYTSGIIQNPENVTVLGGKTGTTNQAGACVILYVRDFNDNFYIAIIMGAPTRNNLYRNMSRLLTYVAGFH